MDSYWPLRLISWADLLATLLKGSRVPSTYRDPHAQKEHSFMHSYVNYSESGDL